MGKIETIYDQYMYSYPHKETYREVEAELVKAYLGKVEASSLYVHIPFCESKCGYCNLFSKVLVGNELEDYLAAVSRQIKEYASYMDTKSMKPKELILGGGTPLILNETQLEKLFRLIETFYAIDYKETFIGVETSPQQATEEKMRYLKEKGINRVSIGIQSFHDKELKTLKRKHLSEDIHKALNCLKKIDFDILNIDLIYGIPGQTIESLLASLEQALHYEPDELFIYPLYIRKHTGLYRGNQTQQALQHKMYQHLVRHLREAGYKQTSMRRFVKHEEEGHSCGFEEMIALGCGGRSYIKNLHFCEPYSAKATNCMQTIHQFNKKERFLEGLTGYVLDEMEQKRRYVIKNLMFYKGIHIKEYEQIWKSHLKQEFPLIEELISKKWATEKEDCICLTEEGLGLSDYIGPLFISPTVKERMLEADD